MGYSIVSHEGQAMAGAATDAKASRPKATAVRRCDIQPPKSDETTIGCRSSPSGLGRFVPLEDDVAFEAAHLHFRARLADREHRFGPAHRVRHGVGTAAELI